MVKHLETTEEYILDEVYVTLSIDAERALRNCSKQLGASQQQIDQDIRDFSKKPLYTLTIKDSKLSNEIYSLLKQQPHTVSIDMCFSDGYSFRHHNNELTVVCFTKDYSQFFLDMIDSMTVKHSIKES